MTAMIECEISAYIFPACQKEFSDIHIYYVFLYERLQEDIHKKFYWRFIMQKFKIAAKCAHFCLYISQNRAFVIIRIQVT